jgi:preprotein translocase subunit SecY
MKVLRKYLYMFCVQAAILVGLIMHTPDLWDNNPWWAVVGIYLIVLASIAAGVVHYIQARRRQDD